MIEAEAIDAPVIVASGLSKWYGSVVAVNEVSLQIGKGITGLLGPNGAGKTTLLHMLAGLSSPSRGTVTAVGEPVRGNPDLYRRMGVMSEHDALYEFYTGRQFVRLAAALHQIPDADRAAEAAIETVNLASVEERSISTYSRGMRQRIRLAASIVHQPEILFLDEPLSGTDPRQRIEFQRFLREYADQGRTVIVSSHILEEVETLADRILLLISGKLAASGDFRAIRSRLDQRPYKVLVECSNPRRLAARLVALEAVESVYIDDQQRLTLLSRQVGVLQKAIPRLAKEEGVRVNRVEPLDDSLESVFTYLVEG